MANGCNKPIESKVAFRLWLAILIALPALAQAEGKQSRPGAALEQERIHAIYSEGDFDGVIAAIDSFTQANRTFSHGDSVFIAKHLAVVYTANPATREKGKNYMFRLLSLLPSAKIVDMFVSDEIDHIFERVREEYDIKMRALGKQSQTRPEADRFATKKMTAEENPERQPAAEPKMKLADKKEKSSSHVFLFVAGGVTIAAVAAYYLLQPEKPADKVYAIPD
jgi:hypothetical protein